MKNLDKNLNDYVALAIEHYNDASKPSVYAAAAALIIARDAAAELNPESANAAAFIAAYEHAASIIDFTQLLTELENQKTAANAAMKNTRAKTDDSNTPESTKLPVKSFFDVLAEQQQPLSSLDMRKLYNETYNAGGNENHRAALNAACAHYAHAYASTYSAYVHAIAVAARLFDKNARQAVFVAAFTKRLNADLNHQPVEPGFFMAMMCSDTTQVMGTIILIAGLIALGLAIGGLTIPAVGAAITAATLSCVPIGATGMAMTLLGVGLFSARASTMGQWTQDNEMSKKAVEAVYACG